MSIKILDENRIQLLSKLDSLPFIKDYSLGGGTALSLQKTYRQSYDFVFFTDMHFDTNELLTILKSNFDNIIVIDQREKISTLNLYINDIQVSFFEYKYKPIRDFVHLSRFKNIKLLSIYDILAMKCVAIAQRGSKKDFFDTYFILKENCISPETLIKLLIEKFNEKNLIKNLIFSIGYFADAEKDLLPLAFVEYSWEDIKSFFVNYQKNLLRSI